jgi:hypothetical protein
MCLKIPKRINYTGYVACMGHKFRKILVGKPEGKSHFEDLVVEERIILKGSLKK